MKKNNLFNLFITMFKIGLFTFGGGYAMISLLEIELVSNKKWIKKDDFFNMVAIAESTPGPVAINCATYVGYKLNGVLGSVIATFGVVLPSFTIIYIISLFFDQFLSLKYVELAFKGLQVGVIYLILFAGLKLFKDIEKNIFSYFIFLMVLILMIFMSIMAINFSSIIFIIVSGLFGIIFNLIKNKLKGGEK